MELRFLAFSGPHKDKAKVSFGAGLNIIYGPSNTGKSSIVDAIDFMFGRERSLDEKAEHEGYDRVLLGLNISDGRDFTLVRSLLGDVIECYSGLHDEKPNDISPEILRLKKATKKYRTISEFLFSELKIGAKKLRKNAKNHVVSLTLRNSIALALVDETEIQKKGSPYFHNGFTKITEEASRLKFFLTGVDDSSLLPEETEKKVLSKSAKVEILSELIKETTSEIEAKFSSLPTYSELVEQSKKLNNTIEFSSDEIENLQKQFETLKESKHSIQDQNYKNDERLNEVSVMLKRFELLENKYSSDIARLENISEVGTLFAALPKSRCPLCGSTQVDTHLHEGCDEDVEPIIKAAASEQSKLLSLKSGLTPTIEGLRTEHIALREKRTRNIEELDSIDASFVYISQEVRARKFNYNELIEKKIEVNNGLRLWEQKHTLQTKLDDLTNETEKLYTPSDSKAENSLPTSALYNLSNSVKYLLNSWDFPMSSDVHFDKEMKDFVINGKHRSSNGKGFRALTHAAASLGLMKFLEDNTQLPHFGFVLLDSPLLAYEKPDDNEDDLSGTDVNLKFFDSLSKWKSKQIIIIENKKSMPEAYKTGEQITQFTGNDEGRWGFFPR